jgi:hypothetical protein
MLYDYWNLIYHINFHISDVAKHFFKLCMWIEITTNAVGPTCETSAEYIMYTVRKILTTRPRLSC